MIDDDIHLTIIIVIIRDWNGEFTRASSAKRLTKIDIINRHQNMDLSDLPDSVLLNIFEYLPIRTRLQLRRVCSKWFNLLYDFSIWKNINLSDESLFTSRVNEDIVIEWILRWGNTIKELNFKEAKWISEKTITAVVRNCPDLQGLNIEGCFQISDPALVRISFQCRRLESVNLFLSGVSDVGFDCLAMNCPELNRIKLGSRGKVFIILFN